MYVSISPPGHHHCSTSQDKALQRQPSLVERIQDDVSLAPGSPTLDGSYRAIAENSKIPHDCWGSDCFCKGDSVDRNNFRIFIYFYDVATFWRCEKWHKNSPTFTFERTSAKKNVHRASLFPSLDLVPPQKGQKWRYDGFSDWAQIDSCKYVGSISKVPKMPHCKSSLVKVVKEISRSLICALKHPSHVRQNPRKSDEMRI